MADLTDALAESPLASEGFKFAISTEIDEGVVASDVWTVKVKPGELMIEAGVAHDLATLGNKSALGTVLEQGVVGERWRVSRALGVQSSGAVSEVWHAAFSPSQREPGRASDVLLTTTHYNLSRVETGRATEGWTWADTKGWGDTGAASDVVSYAYVAGLQVIEPGVAQDTLTPVRKAFTSVIERGVEHTSLTDNYHYNDSLIERAVARVGYLAPSGNSTTWAINLRTQAISEYKGFNFDSFAPMGRKFLGANAAGLFELNGAQDDTAPVLSQIGGGYFQANQMKQSGLKGVYIAVGGQGPQTQGTWLLKLLMGDGREMIYKATSNPGLMVSKINIGKGLRANYMAWELQNFDGQDFDLDKIEFVPMMSGRRVG